MKATLEVINRMRADGVIGDYAIGGAVGATFYLAPAATVDLDLFVTLPGDSGLLLSLSPIYEYLKSRGGTEQDEYIVVKDWPVQFLTPGNALQKEAVKQAISTTVEGVPTRVISAETWSRSLSKPVEQKITLESCNFWSRTSLIDKGSRILWCGTGYWQNGFSSNTDS